MDRKFTYWDNQDCGHLSCPICMDDECEGHPGLVTAIPLFPEKKEGEK